jgi:hypothetical protein
MHLLKLPPDVIARRCAKLFEKMAERIAERTSEKYLDSCCGVLIVLFGLHRSSTGG